MSKTANLRCACGTVRGTLAEASLKSVNRVVCYCDDCQAYLLALSREDLMDEHGGTDIVQVAPGRLTFAHGTDHIQGLRLTEKGLYRWYARCCNTPLGNTVGPKLPFVGIVAGAFEDETQDLDDLFGPPVAGVFGKYAIGHAPECAAGMSLGVMARFLRLMLGWRFRGQNWPNPFFERASGAARYPVTTLPEQDRDALRPLCGPSPSTPAHR